MMMKLRRSPIRLLLTLLLCVGTFFTGKLLLQNESLLFPFLTRSFTGKPLLQNQSLLFPFLTRSFAGKPLLQNQSMRSSLLTRSFAPHLNIQNPVEFSNELDFNCTNVKLIEAQFPMCLYGAQEDIYVSKAFIQGGYFEENSVLNFVNMLKDHTDFTFVDIGANLGTYSIPLARLGRHVVAVEPNWNTLRRLSKSVFLGGDASNVDILFNAIGNKRSTTMLKFDRSNRGNTVLMNNITCKENCETINTSVSIVTLNDLFPIMRNRKAVIKVDTEGTEINIFTSNSAAEFFHTIDVHLIQMEWFFYVKLYSQTPEKRQMVDNFVQFFFERNYTVFDKISGQKLDLEWTKWPPDVCFKKASSIGQLYSV